MYQMSQGGSGCGYESTFSGRCSYTAGGSQLEYITNSNAPKYSSNGNVAYSVSSRPLQESSMTINCDSKPLSYQQKEGLNYHLFNKKPEYLFQPDNFLLPGKGTKFVGRAEEVRGFVEETFEKIFEQPFPADIKVSVLNEKQFRKLTAYPGTLGLSINRSNVGLLSEIFVLNDTLGKVLLTVGHELGHVLTPSLPNQHDEEAKAYAFSLIWMKTIEENNIAGLGNAIILDSPAQNGLHNVAFEFVHGLVKQGKEVGEIYLDLIRKIINLRSSC